MLSHNVFATGGDSMRSKVALSFLAVWRRNQKSPRLSLPLLKAADVLYTDGGLEDLPQEHPFFGEPKSPMTAASGTECVVPDWFQL